MRCELCPINTIKLGYTDGPCVPCRGHLNIDNGMRTACVDPYTNVPIHIDDQQYHITIVFSAIGCCLNIFILIVFVVNRKTPIVRSSDKSLSILHLTSLLLIFVSIICLRTIPYLSIEICVGRNLIYSILYTLHVACLYTKSQKLVMVFASNVRITASEARNTNVTQIFTIVILLFITNVGLLSSYFLNTPQLVSKNDQVSMIRYLKCNTLSNQNNLIIFLTCCQMICSVQAYRCRALPDVMNEAMSLFYSILVTSVSFGVSFPISYFRQQQIDKEFLGVAVLMINCFVTIFLLYGKKCYIMVFKPRQNTRKYFNNHRMKHSGVTKE
ncbi:metabotropic glutamate receptor 4-like [Clytia hemisphaerica]|uniref:metabotropic glutamate receptor 4-like n=1 Tax=Clytia hemisphaerica TaxID=252671 RepID=UPI0034D7A437